MKLKQDTKVEADKLVRDIKRATSAEIESSRTTKKPHRRHDEALSLCDACIDYSLTPYAEPKHHLMFLSPVSKLC